MALAWRLLLLLCTVSALAQDGIRVDLGTHKLNIVCTGAPHARPVVILEAGGGGTSAAWSAVQAALPATIRACAYDRAGSGKSDPGPPPRTMDADVADLHALLERSGVTGPIVFVGQSLGGILARLYLRKYSDFVAGMLLVDPTDEDSVLFNGRLNRWIKVRDLDDSLGEGGRNVAKDREENPVPLRNRPLIVIGAGRRSQPPGLSAEQWLEMRNERDVHLKELTKLSGNSRFILDPASGHNVERDNPKLVAKAIQDLVNEISLSRRPGQ
jgi:pimeloyl-ACP methyl ester carboxylesterase